MHSFTDKIRHSCAKVSKMSENVKIDYDNLSRYALSLPIKEGYKANFNNDWHYFGEEEGQASYIFALDSINFGSGYFDDFKKIDGLSGYMSVATRLKNKYECKPLTANDLMCITPKICFDIFKQDINSAQMQELMNKFSLALNEMGEFIIKEYEGSFSNLLLSTNNSVEVLAEKLSHLKMFHDVSNYKGFDVPIYKRAQITAADIYLGFENTGIGKFNDIDKLTIFADNAVPHVLRMENIFKYSDYLINKIDNKEYLESGEDAEIELRACSIHAVEEMVKILKANHFNKLSAMNIDHYIWDTSHNDQYRSKPKHKTKTNFY